MRNRLLFFFLILLLPLASFAQEHLIKVNPLGLIGRNLTVGYEYVIDERRSAAINVNYWFGLSGFTTNLIEDLFTSTETQREASSAGFSLTPQYRFYAGQKGAPQGFYFAPYLRFSRRTLDLQAQFDGTPAQIDLNLTAVGAGAQIGVQWLLGEQFVIDWYPLGLGLYYHRVTAAYASESLSDIEADIREELADLPIIGGNFDIESQNSRLKAGAGTLFPSLRTGLSVGVFF
jgi:hypothetical protein